ncbi:hypothetical protein CsSME_00035569 [Camellia sinensis var. sinensis]
MESKPSLLRNILVRLFVFDVLIIAVRFAYVVTIRGESCDLGSFCFFSSPENLNLVIGVQNRRSSAIISNDAALIASSATCSIPGLPTLVLASAFPGSCSMLQRHLLCRVSPMITSYLPREKSHTGLRRKELVMDK